MGAAAVAVAAGGGSDAYKHLSILHMHPYAIRHQDQHHYFLPMHLHNARVHEQPWQCQKVIVEMEGSEGR